MNTYKRMITSMLAMMIIFTVLRPVHAASSFTDIDEVPWAIDSIHYLAESGVVNGVGEQQFAPHKELTRGEAAKIIALLFELEVNMDAKTSLMDAKNHWASPYIKVIQSEKPGVIDGYPDGTFKPNHFVTREELTKMIVTAYGFEMKDIDYSVQFNDVSGWATEYIDILASQRIIEGKGNGIFAPKEHVNRAEATVMFHRAEQLFPITIDPVFNVIEEFEQDGIKLEVMLAEEKEWLFVKAKATNVSDDTISYFGINGCDEGFSAQLFADHNGDEIQVGQTWMNPMIRCPQMIMEGQLEPGKTIEELEILSTLTEDIYDNYKVKVTFQKGRIDEHAFGTPIEIEIPIKF